MFRQNKKLLAAMSTIASLRTNKDKVKKNLRQPSMFKDLHGGGICMCNACFCLFALTHSGTQC